MLQGKTWFQTFKKSLTNSFLLSFVIQFVPWKKSIWQQKQNKKQQNKVTRYSRATDMTLKPEVWPVSGCETEY